MKHYTPSFHRLITLAKERPNLLAGPLDLYKEQEGLDDEQLAAQLGCELGAIARLALCERPRPHPHFREDVERIAAYIQVDTLQLATLIRAIEARVAFSHKSGATSPALLAARDHEEFEDSETTPENQSEDE